MKRWQLCSTLHPLFKVSKNFADYNLIFNALQGNDLTLKISTNVEPNNASGPAI